MIEAIRSELSWGSKPMGRPDIQKYKSNTQYLRAIWNRIGGIWETNKQHEVASVLGLSLPTLKRYLSNNGACPYPVQFCLEHLAGMNDVGYLYKIESSVGRYLQPFSAALSIQVGNSWTTYIALTKYELDAILALAQQNDIEVHKVEVII